MTLKYISVSLIFSLATLSNVVLILATNEMGEAGINLPFGQI
jgi:hypothetical protein